jgi:carboxypeptidase Taq
MKAHDLYADLHSLSRHAQLLSGVAALLDWDQATYMPPAGDDIRSEQLKELAALVHQRKTGAPFTKALGQLIDIESGTLLVEGLTPAQAAAVKLWRRDYLQDVALPPAFVEEFAQTTALGHNIWRKAKEGNAFGDFAPLLEKIVSLCRRKADYIGYDEHPYDALLDLFEPGISTRAVGELFTELKGGVTSLVSSLMAAPQVDDRFLSGNFSADNQLTFSWKLLEDMGFNRSSGRLDLSAHPFSSSAHPSDNRITTRIHPTSVASNIFTVLHEGGHALYEMALPADEYGSPLGQALSHGIHESQSRWWETRIGKSLPFWRHYYPILQGHFPEALGNVPLESFYRAINKVQPSLIRVEADDVTYSLHVILRFELERALIEGSLAIVDLPEAWRAKMVELLGIEPSTDREGCLQDVHWSMGAFGYFPSYALGNLYGGQLFAAFEKLHPNWGERVAVGELGFIRLWLNENVHRHGRRYTTAELLEKVSGEPFNATPYLSFLKDKYSAIYR